MPYRDFTLPPAPKYPPGGKVVRTRVSDEATMSWFARWLEAPSMTQDRPPDVDTEFHRLWIAEQDDAEMAEQLASYAARPFHTEMILASFTVETVGRVVKLIIGSGTGPGKVPMMDFRIKGEHGDKIWMDQYRLFGADELDEANDALQQILEALCTANALVNGEDHWMIALPSYFESFDEEMELASAERKQERMRQAGVQ